MRTGLATLGLALLLVAGPARADGYDETEYRLKTAGVDEALRERIHVAIRRAVACLRRLQQRDGSFGGDLGHTALCGLALRHAGIPDAVEGARLAIRYLKARTSARPTGRTYVDGILAMLLEADGSEARWSQAIHDLLAKAPKRDQGAWGYASGGQGSANLSTAQYGGLGLWAGERRGAPVARQAWRRHLEAMLDAQQHDGSWNYSVRPQSGSTSSGYPCGTYMGFANLTLASAALDAELRENPRLWTRVLLAKALARTQLRRHVAWELDAPTLPILGTWHAYYRLYALEKVCVFTDQEELAGRRWYVECAERLLATQGDDGGWGTPYRTTKGRRIAPATSPANTAFALLVLLRASRSYHPVTPRPVDRAPVITPGDDPNEPMRTPGPPLTSLAKATALLDSFEAWLGERKIDTPGRAMETFDGVRGIWSEYRPADTSRSEAHDAWCRRAQHLLLRTSTRFLESTPRHRARWQAVAIEALDTLATTDRRVAPVLMRMVEGMPSKPAFSGSYPHAWYSAALDALACIEAPALAPWITERLLSPDRRAWARTSSALITLGGIRGLRGRQRHAAIRGILTKLAPLLGRSGSEPVTRDLQIDVAVTVRRLAGPGVDGFPTFDARTTPSIAHSVRSWWSRHRDASDPLWSD